MSEIQNYRAGFVAIIGEPNAGKSTLLNQLVKEKISIVSAKPQTTRRRVLGIVSEPRGQVIYIDSPGYVESSKGLNAFLSAEADRVIEDAEALILVVGLDEKKKENFLRQLDRAKKSGKPLAVIVTKLDLIEHRAKLSTIREILAAEGGNIRMFEYSDNWGKDRQIVIKDILDWSLSVLPLTPRALFAEDDLTTMSLRDLTAEIVREKCFHHLEQELPYQLAVRVTEFNEKDAECTRILADVLVGKESHQRMVVGAGASMIKAISQAARQDLEKLLEKKLFLKVDVKVENDWMNNPKIMKELGYSIERNN